MGVSLILGPIYSSLEAFFSVLLGEYTPVGYTVDGNFIVAGGFAGVDWEYLVRAFAFLLVLYCLFRILGAVLCK